MAMGLQYYPPSVSDVPPNLTRPGKRYRFWVGLVLVSLFLFLALYLALVAGAGYLVYLAITYPMPDANRFSVLLKLGAIACSVMLFLFLLKGLFKRHQGRDDDYVEITEAEHPELYAFIRRLCRETCAPFPHRIFVDPDVNASVFYDTSLLNLVVPVKKNLVIGLGLVNVLPMSEFKAVLAHEFGHFSQSSMALGSYVYIANRIIADMVFGRDSWDDMLSKWKRVDFRIGIFAWILQAAVWLLRQLLAGAFRVINLAERALSRQMEFHADLVAVSVTGSDAIVHALSRLEFAARSLMQAQHDLSAALTQGLYTRDLFYHQTKAMDFLRAQEKNPALGAPPPLPEQTDGTHRVFQSGEDRPPSMWSSHPANTEREENAKRHYLAGVLDDRSPWLLFRNPEELRERVTMVAYQNGPGLPNGAALADPAIVQNFIDEEHGETTYDERYFGLYDSRYLEPGNIPDVVQAIRAHPWTRERLAQAYRRLYGGSLKEWAEQHEKRLGEYQVLSGLEEGELKLRSKQFDFRGSQYRGSDVKRLRAMVDEELKQDGQWLEKLDREVFLAHFQMAAYLGGHEQEHLVQRYTFHVGAQEVLRALAGEMARAEAIIAFLQQHRELDEEQGRQVAQHFAESRAAYGRAIEQARGLRLPALKNMREGDPLSGYLQPTAPVPELGPDGATLDGAWIDAYLKQLSEALLRVKRVHFKSLGTILALQEQIAAQWRAVVAPTAPAQRPASSEHA